LQERREIYRDKRIEKKKEYAFQHLEREEREKAKFPLRGGGEKETAKEGAPIEEGEKRKSDSSF